MALRVLVVMMLLVSPMSGVSSAIAAACGDGIGGSARLVEMVESCPLCSFSDGSVYCGCGCGEIEQTPVPESSDAVPMVLSLFEPIEFDEVEITAIVLAIEGGEDSGGFVELAEDDRLALRGGIQRFLAVTGHWIL